MTFTRLCYIKQTNAATGGDQYCDRTQGIFKSSCFKTCALHRCLAKGKRHFSTLKKNHFLTLSDKTLECTKLYLSDKDILYKVTERSVDFRMRARVLISGSFNCLSIFRNTIALCTGKLQIRHKYKGRLLSYNIT